MFNQLFSRELNNLWSRRTDGFLGGMGQSLGTPEAGAAFIFRQIANMWAVECRLFGCTGRDGDNPEFVLLAVSACTDLSAVEQNCRKSLQERLLEKDADFNYELLEECSFFDCLKRNYIQMQIMGLEAIAAINIGAEKYEKKDWVRLARSNNFTDCKPGDDIVEVFVEEAVNARGKKMYRYGIYEGFIDKDNDAILFLRTFYALELKNIPLKIMLVLDKLIDCEQKLENIQNSLIVVNNRLYKQKLL